MRNIFVDNWTRSNWSRDEYGCSNVCEIRFGSQPATARSMTDVKTTGSAPLAIQSEGVFRTGETLVSCQIGTHAQKRIGVGITLGLGATSYSVRAELRFSIELARVIWF